LGGIAVAGERGVSAQLTWQQVVLRLALTVAAGALIGLNRSERGRPAGVRTVILVSLAACVAMLQVNRLLMLAGKDPTSFVVMDLMRLPLGILSGMGFIGAGAILKRGSVVVGLTTAATLWLMTVVGLCFGAGQLGLGGVTTAIAAAVLWGTKRVDMKLARDRRALLVIASSDAEGSRELVQRVLASARLDASYQSGTYGEEGLAELQYVVRWRGAPMTTEPSEVLAQLRAHPGVRSVRWSVERGDDEASG
jgi:putative Mg2+ transporter-C (MgtC) family protein